MQGLQTKETQTMDWNYSLFIRVMPAHTYILCYAHYKGQTLCEMPIHIHAHTSGTYARDHRPFVLQQCVPVLQQNPFEPENKQNMAYVLIHVVVNECVLFCAHTHALRTPFPFGTAIGVRVSAAAASSCTNGFREAVVAIAAAVCASCHAPRAACINTSRRLGTRTSLHLDWLFLDELKPWCLHPPRLNSSLVREGKNENCYYCFAIRFEWGSGNGRGDRE